MADKKIKCIDCNKDFIFSAGEQEFFEEKGYSEPIRCKDCRGKKKAEKRTGSVRHY
jgi:DNA-directed RNA polymerase subunit RPC12/RpoP